MNIFSYIEVRERYLEVDDEMQDLYFQLGIPLPLSYKYKPRLYSVDDIRDVFDIIDCPDECLVVFHDGHKIVVLEDPNELYIRINDKLNGYVDEN